MTTTEPAAATATTTDVPGAVAVLDVLSAWGVDRLFTCPGSTEAPILEASLERPRLELVLATHEAAAVAMADGYARATGRPAVAYLHTDLGLANATSQLASARLASSPVVVLNGLKTTRTLAVEGFTASPRVRQLAAVHCTWEWQTLHVDRVVEDVDEAMRRATVPPGGPTWLGIPQDLLRAALPHLPAAAGPRAPIRVAPHPDDVRAAVALLDAADRPIVVAGSEVVREDAFAAVAHLAEELDAPLLEEDRWSFERSVVPTDHPRAAGAAAPGLPAVAAADAIVLVGARSPQPNVPVGGPWLPPGTPLVHVHVDPRELARRDATAVAVQSGVTLACETIAAALGPPSAEQAASRRQATCAAAAAHAEAREQAATVVPSPPDSPLRVEEVMAVLAHHVDERTTIVSDAVTSEPALLRQVPRRSGDAYLTTASGNLGWGIPAAVGFALGRPDRHVIAVVGDGAAQFGIQALATAGRLAPDVTFLVINNGAYAAVRSSLWRLGGRAAAEGRYPATDTSGVDLSTIATGFGVPGTRVRTRDGLAAALRRSAREPGPRLVEVLTDPAVFPQPSRR